MLIMLLKGAGAGLFLGFLAFLVFADDHVRIPMTFILGCGAAGAAFGWSHYRRYGPD